MITSKALFRLTPLLLSTMFLSSEHGADVHAQDWWLEDAKIHPLRHDPKLRTSKISLVATLPKRSEVIQLLENSTGLRLTVAPNIAAEDTIECGFQMPNCEPSLLMEALAAENVLKNGKWTKTDYGYHLTGELIEPRDRLEPEELAQLEAEEAEQKKNARNTSGPSPQTRWWLIGVSGGAIVLISLLLLWQRLRTRRPKLDADIGSHAG